MFCTASCIPAGEQLFKDALYGISLWFGDRVTSSALIIVRLMFISTNLGRKNCRNYLASVLMQELFISLDHENSGLKNKVCTSRIMVVFICFQCLLQPWTK